MGPMTPELYVFLAKFGSPKLRLIPRHIMARNERRRAHIHSREAAREHHTLQRRWRFMLRNNALRRANRWLAKGEQA